VRDGASTCLGAVRLADDDNLTHHGMTAIRPPSKVGPAAPVSMLGGP
jgi:hypothetical protein